MAAEADAASDGGAPAARASALWSGFASAVVSSVTEFVDTLSNENSDLIDDVRQRSKVVADNVKGSIQVARRAIDDAVVHHDGLTSISTSLVGLFVADDSSTTPRKPPGLAAGTGLGERIQAMQREISSYISDPAPTCELDEDVAERYAAFRRAFVADAADNDAVLEKHAVVKAFYDELVPEKVSSDEFWARYRFRVGELTAEEARRQQMLAQNAGLKAEVAIPDLDLTWGDDDDDDDDESAPTRNADDDAGRADVGTGDDREHKESSPPDGSEPSAPAAADTTAAAEHDDDWENWS